MRTWLALIAIGAFGISDSLSAAATMPVVTAAVHDYAGVAADVLAEAEQEASHIFRHAGVQLMWVDTLVNRTTVRVHVLSAAMTVRTGARPEVLGLATVQSGMAYILYDHVLDKSESVNVRTSRVLGYVMAHEIGHVLLAGRRHGHVGLMKPRLDPEVLRTGLIAFTSQEGREMRAFLLWSQ